MGPCTVLPKAAFLDDDNISDGDEDDSKDKINSPNFDNRTPKYIKNGKRLCNGDAEALCPKYPGFYICSCPISNKDKDHEQVLVNR